MRVAEDVRVASPIIQPTLAANQPLPSISRTTLQLRKAYARAEDVRDDEALPRHG